MFYGMVSASLGGILEVGWAFGFFILRWIFQNRDSNPHGYFNNWRLLLFLQNRLKILLFLSTAYAVSRTWFIWNRNCGNDLGDSVSAIKIILVMILISCIIGLKFVSNEPKQKADMDGFVFLDLHWFI